MSKTPRTLLCPARPSAVKILGRNLVDQLLKAEQDCRGADQFRAKKEIISHFEKHEPDLFPYFRDRVVSPYQFLIKVQRAFEKQTDVVLDGVVISKRDATEILNRYIPNLQYLHDNQLYTNADSLKELGASLAIGVVATGLTEAVGRAQVSNPYLSMEMALLETMGIGLLSFIYLIGARNRNMFHKAPWNSAIYLGANLYETNPDNWEAVTWKQLQQGAHPFKGFTLLKTRPHYEALDNHVSRRDVNSPV